MGPAGPGRTRIEFTIPSRGLIGYRNEFLTDTRGTGILNHSFREYGAYAGPLKGRVNGVLIVQDPGESNTYALFYLQGAVSCSWAPASASMPARSWACTRGITI